MRIALALLIAVLTAPASATWKAEYATQPEWIQEWYRNAPIMPRAQERLKKAGHGWAKCCDHADVVETKFRVSKRTGGDLWFWWNPSKAGDDKWDLIPDDIIHWGESAPPDGKPTLFVYDSILTCFFPGDGGI